MADIRETLHVDATAEHVYAMVSDLPRMGEWSPECDRVTWRDGASGARPGAKFLGHNRVGAVRWTTFGEVVVAEPGRNLAFEVTAGPVALSRWEYFFVPDEDGSGCTVAEEWTDRRPAWYRFVADRAFGNRMRTNAQGIRATLLALRRAAETRQLS